MDYTTSPVLVRMRKVARYLRLYGVRRTIAKVDAQYHMKRTYGQLPDSNQNGPHGHVGIIGCGNFAFSTIAYYLKRNYGSVIRGVMDVDATRAASLGERYRAHYYSVDVERILSDPEIDLVYIASNHASHADYAIRALERGKSVHIEKPHVVTFDQLRRLGIAMQKSRGGVRLGFNRSSSRLGEEIRTQLAAQTGTAMLNWFVAGHEIPVGHWYYREEEGGRVPGNLCHWTDFLYQMIPPENRYPIEIRPTRSESSPDDIAVTYVFGDGSIGAITFSAKGHMFEGVRERFSAHRGDALISMDDFAELRVELVHRKIVRRQVFRDHGHERTIQRAYQMVRPSGDPTQSSLAYVWESAELFLRTKQALDNNEVVTVTAFSDHKLRSV